MGGGKAHGMQVKVEDHDLNFGGAMKFMEWQLHHMLNFIYIYGDEKNL